jgi:HEAT repeat protein
VMKSTSIDDLFACTLKGDYEGDEPWEAVRALRRLGTREVFDVAAAWCKSADPLKRARGVNVLSQLGKTPLNAVNSFPDESYAIVSELVQQEKEICPLDSAIAALGHLDNDAAVPLIAPFHDHPSADIRFSVACSLGSFPNVDLSASTLLVLMEDSDSEVRDWATFGLGVQVSETRLKFGTHFTAVSRMKTKTYARKQWSDWESERIDGFCRRSWPGFKAP